MLSSCRDKTHYWVSKMWLCCSIIMLRHVWPPLLVLHCRIECFLVSRLICIYCWQKENQKRVFTYNEQWTYNEDTWTKPAICLVWFKGRGLQWPLSHSLISSLHLYYDLSNTGRMVRKRLAKILLVKQVADYLSLQENQWIRLKKKKKKNTSQQLF